MGQRLRRERMTLPQLMKTNQAQKCCKKLDGALKVHTGRLSAKGMRTNILEWGRRMQTSTHASHRDLNRSSFVNMPPTASMRSVHLEAHSARRFCVHVAENLF